MEEQLIIFETAKLAKEKGFKEWCTTAYINRSYLCEYHIADIYYKYTCKEDFPLVKDCVSFLVPRSEPWFKAPTQSLLQKWLREVHDIHIVVYIFKPEDKNKYCCDIVSDKFEENLEDDQNFDTYEEALEQALYQALELIK